MDWKNSKPKRCPCNKCEERRSTCSCTLCTDLRWTNRQQVASTESDLIPLVSKEAQPVNVTSYHMEVLNPDLVHLAMQATPQAPTTYETLRTKPRPPSLMSGVPSRMTPVTPIVTIPCEIKKRSTKRINDVTLCTDGDGKNCAAYLQDMADRDAAVKEGKQI